MGRPPTGVDPMFSVRLPPELIKRIDDYAEQNEESRSHAMRELLEAGLIYKAATAGGKRSRGRLVERARAADDHQAKPRRPSSKRDSS